MHNPALKLSHKCIALDWVTRPSLVNSGQNSFSKSKVATSASFMLCVLSPGDFLSDFVISLTVAVVTSESLYNDLHPSIFSTIYPTQCPEKPRVSPRGLGTQSRKPSGPGCQLITAPFFISNARGKKNTYWLHTV